MYIRALSFIECAVAIGAAQLNVTFKVIRPNNKKYAFAFLELLFCPITNKDFFYRNCFIFKYMFFVITYKYNYFEYLVSVIYSINI